VVYILEAHPIDAWQQEANVKDKIAVATPRSFEERCAVAETCATKLALQIPAIVDDIQNSTEISYTAWPDRLYVIDRAGRVAYKSNPGPFGFKPEEVRKTLENILPATPTNTTAELSH
jgi:type I thyroxine 5'-deiodinase